jgi:hypothetical protein
MLPFDDVASAIIAMDSLTAVVWYPIAIDLVTALAPTPVANDSEVALLSRGPSSQPTQKEFPLAKH